MVCCIHVQTYGIYGCVYCVSWFNPWSFAVFAGFQDHVNIVGTQKNKVAGSLFFSGFLSCSWNVHGSELTIWPLLLNPQSSSPFYILQPAPNLNSMHGGHTKDHAGPAHGAAASLWGAARFPVKQHENSAGNSYWNSECAPDVKDSLWNLTIPKEE